MGANIRLFWVLAGFFFLAAVVYTIWTFGYDAQQLATDPSGGSGEGNVVEWVGTIGLTLTALLAALIAFYLGRVERGQGGTLPEDREDADIDDGDAEQGFFSPWSWWPVTLAACAALLFLGLAAGVWISIIGAAVGVIALVGWTFEYHRGHFGH